MPPPKAPTASLCRCKVLLSATQQPTVIASRAQTDPTVLPSPLALHHHHCRRPSSEACTTRSPLACYLHTDAHSIHHRPTPDRSSVHRSDRVAITENGPHAPAFQVASYPALELSRSPQAQTYRLSPCSISCDQHPTRLVLPHNGPPRPLSLRHRPPPPSRLPHPLVQSRTLHPPRPPQLDQRVSRRVA